MTIKSHDWSDMVRILDLKTDFEENVGNIYTNNTVKKGLTKESAEWILEKGHRFNQLDNQHYKFMRKISAEYLEIARQPHIVIEETEEIE